MRRARRKPRARSRSRSLRAPMVPIASHTPPCSPRREKRATARSRRDECAWVRAKRSSRSSSERKRLGAEADALIVALCAHVADLRGVDADRSLLALDLVPATLAERLVEGGE